MAAASHVLLTRTHFRSLGLRLSEPPFLIYKVEGCERLWLRPQMSSPSVWRIQHAPVWPPTPTLAPLILLVLTH